ncbi:MAG: undecaprenyl-phosphate glucose phosphotransferase [Kiloniellaceae bacterium]
METQIPESRSRPFSPALVGDLLRLVDLAVILITGFAIYFFYVYPDQTNHPDYPTRYAATLLIAGLLASVLFHGFGVYAGDYVFSRRLRIDRALSTWAATFGVLLAVAFALKISDFYSRVWAVSWFVTVAGLLALGRLMLSHWILRWAREGRFADRTVIVGTGNQARKLAAHLKEQDTIRTRLIGFAGDGERADPRATSGQDVLGGIDDLIRMIRSDKVDQVFIALPWNEADRLREVVRRLAVTPVVIRLAPDMAAFDYLGRGFIQVAGLPVLHLFDRPISGWSHLSKSLEDRVLALLFLILLAPALVVIALAIKLDSRGPVLFKQHRQGFNNNLFEVWKFRTMHTDVADPRGEIQAKKNDPRITRIGHFLRRTSLDELPQLVNVLRGDMSIVGPRPHAVGTKAKGHLFEDVVDSYAGRHRVKPGITGWAQVNGWRGETDTMEKIQKRVECDLYYIDNWSVWLDLFIIAKTLLILFKDERAY